LLIPWNSAAYALSGSLHFTGIVEPTESLRFG